MEEGWTPWRRHFAADQHNRVAPPPPARRRPDRFPLIAGLALVIGYALAVAVIGLLDGPVR